MHVAVTVLIARRDWSSNKPSLASLASLLVIDVQSCTYVLDDKLCSLSLHVPSKPANGLEGVNGLRQVLGALHALAKLAHRHMQLSDSDCPDYFIACVTQTVTAKEKSTSLASAVLPQPA